MSDLASDARAVRIAEQEYEFARAVLKETRENPRSTQQEIDNVWSEVRRTEAELHNAIERLAKTYNDVSGGKGNASRAIQLKAGKRARQAADRYGSKVFISKSR